MSVQSISPQEIAERGLNSHVVWFVYNETDQEVSGFSASGGRQGRITPVFLEKEDAETCRFIASKQAYLQKSSLGIRSEIFQTLFEEIVEDEPEFTLQLYDSNRAKEWFKQFENILLTREFEETRKKET